MKTSSLFAFSSMIYEIPLLRYSVPAKSFEAKYELSDDNDASEAPASAPPAASLGALRTEGFKRFKPRAGAARVWACQMDAATIAERFPAGCFEASWGERMVVHARDWLALTHPVREFSLPTFKFIGRNLP